MFPDILILNSPLINAMVLISKGVLINPMAIMSPFILKIVGAPSYAGFEPANTTAAWTPPFVAFFKSSAYVLFVMELKTWSAPALEAATRVSSLMSMPTTFRPIALAYWIPKRPRPPQPTMPTHSPDLRSHSAIAW